MESSPQTGTEALRRRARAVAPFGINALLAGAAVAGAILAPSYLGRLPGQLLQVQAITVHATGLLYVTILVRRNQLEKGREFPAFIIWVLGAGYALVALEMGGLTGLAEFGLLSGGTFAGALAGEHGPREVARVAARWLIAFFGLLISAAIFGLPENIDRWSGASGSAAAAGVYFGALALAEATSFYRSLSARLFLLYEIARRQPPSG